MSAHTGPQFEAIVGYIEDCHKKDLWCEISSTSAGVLLDGIRKAQKEPPWMAEVHADLKRQMAAYSTEAAAAIAHRAIHSAEHNPQEGKLHGYCAVCGIPWPCETAQYFLRRPKS